MKWFIIGTLLYYAIILWRYRDSWRTWFTSGKRESRQPDNPQLPKAKNTDCIVGTSRYRVGQMRTNGDISGQFSKAVDNASIFAPQSDEAVSKAIENEQVKAENSDIPQPIDTEFEMEYQVEETGKETEEPEVSADEIEAEEIACYMGGEPEMAQGITLGELAQMVQVIQVKQSTETEERQAVQTYCRMETNLFNSVVEQINGGMVRVAELLQKHEIPVPATVSATGNDEVSAFDMNDFL